MQQPTVLSRQAEHPAALRRHERNRSNCGFGVAIFHLHLLERKAPVWPAIESRVQQATIAGQLSFRQHRRARIGFKAETTQVSRNDQSKPRAAKNLQFQNPRDSPLGLAAVGRGTRARIHRTRNAVEDPNALGSNPWINKPIAEETGYSACPDASIQPTSPRYTPIGTVAAQRDAIAMISDDRNAETCKQSGHP